MSAPSGWYPDAYGATRWWDGSAWTSHITFDPPVDQSTAPPAPAPAEVAIAAADGPRRSVRRSGGAVAAAVAVLLVVAGTTAALAVARSDTSDAADGRHKVGPTFATVDTNGTSDAGPATLTRGTASGTLDVEVPVTNSTGQRVDYVLDVAIESADRSHRYDESFILVQGVGPGESTVARDGLAGGPPAAAVARVLSVVRTAGS